jgi:NAD+-processing family protein with receiver domain
VPEFVAILEDEASRLKGFNASITKLLPQVEVVCFDESKPMIAWLKQNLGDTLLISLDHDLPLRPMDGSLMDCGNGREVVEFMSTIPPTCPAIVHSSNNDAAQSMIIALNEAKWPCHRVFPYDGESWISTAWAEKVDMLIHNGWINRSARRTERA